MVTVQVGYCFSRPASPLSARCASLVSSLLSNSKNAGFIGELRFRSSRDAEVIRSSRIGSGGTTVGSATGSGGAGGRPDASLATGGGGGGEGRATGGFLPPHAASISEHAINAATAPLKPTRRIGLLSSECGD